VSPGRSHLTYGTLSHSRMRSDVDNDGVIDQAVHKTLSVDLLERLTSRERQVLQMLAEGHAIADIAARLFLSPRTVETYRTRMMEKLEIHDFATLVKFAIRHGITSLE
jgi:DNA-binding NarL/FixJ family response regulator